MFSVRKNAKSLEELMREFLKLNSESSRYEIYWEIREALIKEQKLSYEKAYEIADAFKILSDEVMEQNKYIPENMWQLGLEELKLICDNPESARDIAKILVWLHSRNIADAALKKKACLYASQLIRHLPKETYSSALLSKQDFSKFSLEIFNLVFDFCCSEKKTTTTEMPVNNKFPAVQDGDEDFDLRFFSARVKEIRNVIKIHEDLFDVRYYISSSFFQLYLNKAMRYLQQWQLTILSLCKAQNSQYYLLPYYKAEEIQELYELVSGKWDSDTLILSEEQLLTLLKILNEAHQLKNLTGIQFCQQLRDKSDKIFAEIFGVNNKIATINGVNESEEYKHIFLKYLLNANPDIAHNIYLALKTIAYNGENNVKLIKTFIAKHDKYLPPLAATLLALSRSGISTAENRKMVCEVMTCKDFGLVAKTIAGLDSKLPTLNQKIFNKVVEYVCDLERNKLGIKKSKTAKFMDKITWRGGLFKIPESDDESADDRLSAEVTIDIRSDCKP